MNRIREGLTRESPRVDVGTSSLSTRGGSRLTVQRRNTSVRAWAPAVDPGAVSFPGPPPGGDLMLSRVRTAALWGFDSLAVECEVDVGPGLPSFVLVGLPDASAREARDRVWPALRNAGFHLPDRRVTVNLAPAERRKEGASADLAVALGIVTATSQAPSDRLAG